MVTLLFMRLSVDANVQICDKLCAWFTDGLLSCAGGIGGELPNILQEVEIPVITEQLCDERWQELDYDVISDIHVCVWDEVNQDKGSCNVRLSVIARNHTQHLLVQYVTSILVILLITMVLDKEQHLSTCLSVSIQVLKSVCLCFRVTVEDRWSARQCQTVTDRTSW